MMTTYTFMLTVSMGKRLIAKGLMHDEYIKNIMMNHRLLIVGGTTNAYVAEEALKLRTELCRYALCFLGVRYADGGTTPRGFDCCGFTYFVFQKQGYDLAV